MITFSASMVRAASIAFILVAVPAAASAPSGRYTVANGTVYDTKTKLTWQQAVPTVKYTRAAAATYCSSLLLNGAGWRVPTVKDLLTIVDYSQPISPVIDANAFPNTPGDTFWSSTVPTNGPGGTYWYVGFSDGSAGILDATLPGSVRCVR